MPDVTPDLTPDANQGAVDDAAALDDWRGLDLTSVDTVLATARSVRRRLDFDRPVPASVIHDCIDIAAQAPTGLGGEAWRFVVVTAAEPKVQLAAVYRRVLLSLFEQRGGPVKPTHQALIDRLHEIPAMIFVYSLGAPVATTAASHVAYYGSVLPAAWSLMLALRARGIGATWTTLLSSEQREVKHILGAPEDVTQTVMLPIAYTSGAKLRRAPRQPAQSITYWNRWGAGLERDDT